MGWQSFGNRHSRLSWRCDDVGDAQCMCFVLLENLLHVADFCFFIDTFTLFEIVPPSLVIHKAIVLEVRLDVTSPTELSETPRSIELEE